MLGQPGGDQIGALLRCGQPGVWIQRLVIAHDDAKILALAEFFRQQAADLGAGLRVAGDTAHLDQIGQHPDIAAIQLAQSLQGRQHPNRPARWQAIVQPGGGIDTVRTKARLGKIDDSGAHPLVRQPAAQLYCAGVSQAGGEFGRPAAVVGGTCGLFRHHCGQREHIRQFGFQIAHHAVKVGLGHLGPGHQRHIGIGKGDGAAADFGQPGDGNGDAFGPTGGWRAEAEGAAGLPRLIR